MKKMNSKHITVLCKIAIVLDVYLLDIRVNR